MNILKQLGLMVLVAIAVVLMYDQRSTIAGFDSSPEVWGGTFEANPLLGDTISEGDDHLRQIKLETRQRLETEHFFGTFETTEDNGRHRLGAARTFFQTAAPTVLGTAGTPVEDYNSSTGGGVSTLDDGRLWVDSDGPDASTHLDNELWVRDQTATAWERVQITGIIPANAIILWDQTNGDEDCDGTSDTAGDCPCGFTRAAEFDGIFPRGAESVADVTDIPEEVGVNCSGYDGATADAECDGTDAEYTSNIPVTGWGADGTPPDAASVEGTMIAASSEAATEEALVPIEEANTAQDRYQPFRTVIFCRRDA